MSWRRTHSGRRAAQCIVAAGLIAISLPGSAASLQDFERTYDAGKRALATHDAAKAESAFKSLLRLAPDHPDLLRAFAQSEAASGDRAAALATYARVAKLGFGGAMVGDPAFQSLRNESSYGSLRAEALRQSRAIAPAREAFALPERAFIHEGLAWDQSHRGRHRWRYALSHRQQPAECIRLGSSPLAAPEAQQHRDTEAEASRSLSRRSISALAASTKLAKRTAHTH